MGTKISQRHEPANADADLKKEKKPRQWLDIIALILSSGAVGFTFFQFYFAELRLADDLSATIMGIGPSTDTNGFYTVEMGLLLRNEGNRQVVVPRISLVLSESPTFDLSVWHPSSIPHPIVVAAKQTVYETMVFGRGRQRFQMLEARRADALPAVNGSMQVQVNKAPSIGEEPEISGKLAIDVMDSRGNMHQVFLHVGTFQRARGLVVRPAVALPWSTNLLPSTAPAPRGYAGVSDRKVSFEYRNPTVTRSVQFDFTGPLGVRLHGVYTNEHDGGWLTQPLDHEFGYTFQGSIVETSGPMRVVHASQFFGTVVRNEVERVVSKDGLHLASVVLIRTNNQALVVLDGKDGQQYDGIGAGSLLFSSDSKHVAYVALKGQKTFVVVDEKAGPEFDGVVHGSLAFTDDSQHLVYIALKDGKQHLVVDGIILGALGFHNDGSPEFTPAISGAVSHVQFRDPR
jgi:hypothetical protein